MRPGADRNLSRQGLDLAVTEEYSICLCAVTLLDSDATWEEALMQTIGKSLPARPIVKTTSLEPQETRAVRLYLEALDDLADGYPVESLDGLRADFVVAAAGYAKQHGIAYVAWSQMGISAQVLREAGLTPTP
jgi:hypothetical protein